MRKLGVRVSEEAFERFAKIHEKTGLQNQGQTFEALVFRERSLDASLEDKINNIDAKLNKILEWIGDPA